MNVRHSLMPGPGVDPEIRVSLGAHLEDILGTELSCQNLDAIFRDFPKEAAEVTEVFKQMSGAGDVAASVWKGSRHWKRATQSSRTEVELAYDEHGWLTLDVRNTSSHGFLSVGSTDLGLRALEGRRMLCSGLRGSLATNTYRSLLEWVDRPGEAKVAEGSDSSALSLAVVQGMAGDSALGASLYQLDVLFQHAFYRLEIQWRQENGADDEMATPPKVVVELVATASEEVRAAIDEAAQQGRNSSNEDSLAVRVAAAVSANRGMDEIWSWCAFEEIAAHDALVILALLRDAGVAKIPEQFGDVTAAKSLDERLDEWLTTYMGSNGLLSGKDTGIRPMGRTDIGACVRLSDTLQQAYIKRQTRIGLGGAWAQRQYGGECVRFIFLLALATAFGNSSRVSNEFPGHKNPTHAVFTPRAEITNNVPNDLSAHAKTHIERMAALIHRSVGDDWAFDLDALRSQRDAKIWRLSRQVEIYKHVVDGRTAGELFGIYQFLINSKEEMAL
ncbi:MAG: hypothetical protein ABL934_00655 [Lysobacteraceae bacterium]